MPDISDIQALGQDLAGKAVGAADSVVGAARDAVRGRVPALEGVVDLVPDPSDVVDGITATASELLTLAQDVQSKVVAALTANA